MAFTHAPTSVVLTDNNGFALNLGAGTGPFTGAPLSVVVTDKTGATMTVGSGSATQKLSSTAVDSWSSTADGTGAADTGISRIGAGSLAVGNGTAGDFSGTIKL